MNNYNHIKVLVVEDNELACQVALLTMRQIGCKVECASTGADALNKTKKNNYDLIFMDLGLPDTEGTMVAKTIREQEGKNKHTLIFALTAHKQEDHQEDCHQRKFDAFITKPLMTSQVLELFKKHNI